MRELKHGIFISENRHQLYRNLSINGFHMIPVAVEVRPWDVSFA